MFLLDVLDMAGVSRHDLAMRLHLLTAGSRGDVEPFAALARAAVGRGHQVRLGLPDNSDADVTGLDTASLGVDFAQVIGEHGVAPLAALRSMRVVMRTLLATALRQALDYEPDVVVAHPKVLSAPLAAARLGIPHVAATPVPVVVPTRAFPAPGVVSFPLGPLNRATYVATSAGNRMFARDLADAARAAGLEPARRPPEPDATLVAISEHLVPRPPDWPARAHLTGPWVRSHATPPDPVVDEFVAGGPFLYAGLGSMASGDPVARASTIVQAARAAGLRALVVTGWGGLSLPAASAGADVLAVRSVDHAAVLPRARAALHHGGAGTVHAVARAGVPSIVVPFVADQPFWGKVLHRRGIAASPIRPRRLTVARLRGALDEADGMRDTAAAVGRSMAGEDGPGRALDVLEGLVGR
jgi:sterol 3beta-glucosyltransferase